MLQFNCEDNMSTNNTINNIIDKSGGGYEVTILLASENSEGMKRYLVTFVFHNNWNDDPDKIISDIEVKEIL